VDYDIFKLGEGDVVLDLGCGEGRHVISTYAEGKNVTSVGVDLSFDDLCTSQKRFNEFPRIHDANKHFALSVGSALNLPFADNTFDKVVCSEVLEHIPDYRQALTEINRVLKPNGLFAVSVPRYWPEKICWCLSDEYHANEGGHLRIFKARALRQEVEHFGMRYIKGHWAHALHSPFWWLKCLFWQTQESNWLVKMYHRLLVWDLLDRPWVTRVVEQCLNPLMGKSVVMYFHKGLS
jgi:ubiquinone/menaquinone biosynthesis C-methylase UbiE